jgi:UDP-N-acetylmuramoyl-tripeptide--D-alanyl-D-alanine ligase
MQFIRQTTSRSFGVVEIGIGRPNQMGAYAAAMRPDIAVVTSVGWEHEKYFSDGLEGIRNEKAELVRALPPDGVAVLNRDDEHVMWMAATTRARIVTFGRHADADIRLLRVEPSREGATVHLSVSGNLHSLVSPLFGAITALPVCAAVATAHAIGRDIEPALRALETLSPTLRRLQRTNLPNGSTLILDDYKGTPATAHAAFDAVAEIPFGRLIAVLGNIPKTTPEPKGPVYERLGKHAGRVFSRVYLIHLADDAYDAYRRALMEGGMDSRHITRVRNVQDAAAALQSDARADDTILVKGHFTDHLSRIPLLLQGMTVRCGLTSCLVRGSHWCDQCPMV